MLNRIQTDEYNIVLRNHSPNIFDIDSVSLLIGKNGSGKTVTLKSIINAFNTSRKDPLKDNCQLHFEGSFRQSPTQLMSWGVIYYTPAQNRPKLRSNNNFIDASKRQIKNMLKIEQHKEVLSAFGLNLELTATLTVDYKKIGNYLAENLISKKSSSASKTNNLFDFEQARLLRRKLVTFSDIESSQEDHDRINESYLEQVSKLSDIILNHLSATEKIDATRTFICFATINHMISLRSVSTATIIEFARCFLETALFVPAKVTFRQLEPFLAQASGALRIVTDEILTKSRTNKYTFSRTLTSPDERSYFEGNPGLVLFDVGFPEVSSGQWAIMRQTIAIYEALIELSERSNITNILLLIDEGDAFLHLDWQRRYILQLNSFLMRCKQELKIKNLQLIIATHSPILATDMPREFVCAMDRSEYASLYPSFAAPLQSILNRSFSSRTIGEFATREINNTIHKINKIPLTEKDHYIISMIDDPIIKNEIERTIKSEARYDN
ncbi:AAA family ATPase [Pseudomonas sp. RT6P73]